MIKLSTDRQVRTARAGRYGVTAEVSGLVLDVSDTGKSRS